MYFRIKNVPEMCNYLENTALSMDKCKQELTKGVQRLVTALETVKKCESEANEINERCIGKLKAHDVSQKKVKDIKEEKEQIRLKILEMQKQKKLKESGNN
jgi:hypothetical protein